MRTAPEITGVSNDLNRQNGAVTQGTRRAGETLCTPWRAHHTRACGGSDTEPHREYRRWMDPLPPPVPVDRGACRGPVSGCRKWVQRMAWMSFAIVCRVSHDALFVGSVLIWGTSK